MSAELRTRHTRHSPIGVSLLTRRSQDVLRQAGDDHGSPERGRPHRRYGTACGGLLLSLVRRLLGTASALGLALVPRHVPPQAAGFGISRQAVYGYVHHTMEAAAHGQQGTQSARRYQPRRAANTSTATHIVSGQQRNVLGAYAPYSSRFSGPSAAESANRAMSPVVRLSAAIPRAGLSCTSGHTSVASLAQYTKPSPEAQQRWQEQNDSARRH